MSIVKHKVDLVEWVIGTIRKEQKNVNWNEAWLNTYFELGGKSKETGKKACPKNAARVLYQAGRIKGESKPYKQVSFQEIKNDSVNGVYALIAIDKLKQNDNIELSKLITSVHSQFKSEFGHAPKSDQGAIALTYKLWHADRITLE